MPRSNYTDEKEGWRTFIAFIILVLPLKQVQTLILFFGSDRTKQAQERAQERAQEGASRQASKHASRQASKHASRQVGKQAGRQASG